MSQTPAPPPRTAPIALWRIAESFLHILHSLFGAPEDVAHEHTLTRAAHALLVSWLRVGEALLRRLLLIEAAAFAGAPNVASTRTRQRARKPMSFTAENPEAWRVSFRCVAVQDRRLTPAEASAKAGPAGIPAHQPAQTCDDQSTACRLEAGGPRLFHSAWPLAERYEALIRVFNAPIAYARRLWRRLHARPHLIAAVLRTTEDYIHRVDDAEALTAAAQRAWQTLDSS